MSAIAGIYQLTGEPVARVALESMLRLLAYRGDDLVDHWSEGPVGLAYRAHDTTPEMACECQPLLSADGRLCLVADARLDNREELRKALRSQGVTPRDESDAELILQSYEVWGEDCPGRLLGDFAFVLWDGRRRQLVCVRDPLGVKSLYYHTDGRTFRFATAPGALFADGCLRREPNVEVMFLFLLGQFGTSAETLDRGVCRVPAAHLLVVRHGQLRTHRYWDVDPERRFPDRTEADCAEHFFELFQESVRARLRACGPVGASLSGGLDSSSVAATAAALCREERAAPAGFETYTLLFDGLPCDERAHAHEAARGLGVPGNFLEHEAERSWLDLDRHDEFLDTPFGLNLFMHGPLLRAAQAKGVRVLLEGVGGDDYLNDGFSHLPALLLRGQLPTLLRQVRRLAAASGTSARSVFLRYCLRPTIPLAVKSALRSVCPPLRRTVVPDWVNETELSRLRLRERLPPPASPAGRTPAQRLAHHRLHNGWNGQVALAALGSFGAHFGVEHRYPFLDRRLVEFLIASLGDPRWNGEPSKKLLRRAMTGVLPERIRLRSDKARFNCLMDRELKGRQADRFRALIRTSRLAALGVIDSHRLERAFERYRLGEAHGSDAYRTFPIFLLLELWCRSTIGCNAEEIHYA